MDMATMKHTRLLCVLALFGCVGSESTSAGSSGGTLAISTGGDPDVLIPSLASTVQATQITDLIYDRLAEIGDSLNIVNDAGFKPRLADRCQRGEQGGQCHCPGRARGQQQRGPTRIRRGG